MLNALFSCALHKRFANSKKEKNKFSSFAINCGAQKKTFCKDDEGIKNGNNKHESDITFDNDDSAISEKYYIQFSLDLHLFHTLIKGNIFLHFQSLLLFSCLEGIFLSFRICAESFCEIDKNILLSSLAIGGIVRGR
jgi:hypothetical protein